jgi:hypothetical protein
MAKLPQKENMPYPSAVEKEERILGYTDLLDIERQRKASGDLPDESPEDPVRNSGPHKSLRGGR